MDLVAKVAAVIVAVALGAAAVAKLRDHSSVAAGFATLGLPAPAALSRLVPAVELIVAVLLIIATPWGATVAFALLLGFTLYLGRLVQLGVTAPCNCFGASSGAPVGRRELIRNSVLLACAALALFSPSIV